METSPSVLERATPELVKRVRGALRPEPGQKWQLPERTGDPPVDDDMIHGVKTCSSLKVFMHHRNKVSHIIIVIFPHVRARTHTGHPLGEPPCKDEVPAGLLGSEGGRVQLTRAGAWGGAPPVGKLPQGHGRRQ